MFKYRNHTNLVFKLNWSSHTKQVLDISSSPIVHKFM